MAAEWLEVRYDGGLASLTMVRGYNVTIVGSQDTWSWFIELHGYCVADGMERDLDAAMSASVKEAHLLADDPGDV